MEEQKPINISIKLAKQVVLDKKGKEVKDEKGDTSYVRNDYFGLQILLNRFDTTIHVPKEYKMFIKVKDKIRGAWIKDEENVDLTLDEGAFLKEFLTNLPEKEAKTKPMQEFELRSMMGILEQFE
jgi:hypothetical protein